MAGLDSPERSKAREELDRAVRNFVEVYAREQGVTDNPIVIGWAGIAEYTSVELTAEESTGTVTMVPDDQYAATTRGLLGFGVDAFTRGG